MNPLPYSNFVHGVANAFLSRPDKEVLNLQCSPNFLWSELFASEASKYLVISNYPDRDIIFYNLAYLTHYALQPIRNKVGAIVVNSAYRCSTVNEYVGGVPTSYHLFGRAADIRPASRDVSIGTLASICNSIPNLKVIKYNTFVHIQI